uniref:OX-2 membrane glycoprotein-like n=1 Tax=Myripristis murdjan TaxID=586833 RepID=A0A667WJV6_9TELE
MACGGAVPLLLLGLFHTGLTGMIQTQQTVMAALGQEALFNCRLTQSKDVLQVTWQRLLPDEEKNLATYNKKFGAKVNPPFQGKVEFESVGLQNCSIVIRKVTTQDESCYRCLFNTYPDGALTARTCLTVYEQYEPVLHVRRSNSSEEPLVSCSATGRPAPAVTLVLPERDLNSSQSNTVWVTNPNGTVTVTATATLSGFHGNGTRVGCEVRLSSGAVRKLFTTIPKDNQSSAAGSEIESGMDEGSFSVTVISVVTAAVVAVVIIVAVVCIILIRKRTKNRQQEDKKKTPVTLKKIDVPLIAQENQQMRHLQHIGLD